MRFLHTADWHIGKTLRGRSRNEEFAAALDEVARIAIEARIDAVLLAGDVFDSPAPPAEAERLVYDFLARLLPDGISAVIIAGNHDHPKRLAALAQLLEGLRIHVRAEIRGAREGGIVGLQSRDGTEAARVAALPFVPERKVFDACQMLGPAEEWYDSYARNVGKMLRELARDFEPASVNVVLAHLLVSGARTGSGERRLHLGEAYGIEAQELPPEAQYIALGHLHRPQQLAAPAPTFYPGSLLELDFGETEQDKRVLLVEAHPGKAARIESVPVHAGRRLHDLSGTLEELRKAAPTLRDQHLRVTVRVVVPSPGIAEHVKELLPNALEIRVESPRQPRTAEGRSSVLRQRRPDELFAEFCRRRDGKGPEPELASVFRQLHDEASRP